MKKKVIAIGPTTQNNKVLHGVSMMFQLIIDELKSQGILIKAIDVGLSKISPRSDRTSGKFTLIKASDYLLILCQVYYTIIFNRNSIIYITAAQSKVGFIRDFFIIQFAAIFRKRIVAQYFGAYYQEFYNSQSGFFKKRIVHTLSKVSCIVVEGDYTKEQFSFLNGYETKVVVLPNGLPEKNIHANFKAKTIEPTQPIKLFYLSNLIETKGFWDVLEASEKLINRHKINMEVVFSGKFLESVDDTKYKTSTEAEKAFQDYIYNHGLTNHIRYYNGLYGDSKAREFSQSHFFLLPSYYIIEGQPVSVLEALAYGCVPIVTPYKLIPMMVNPDNGFYVAPKSPEEIVDVVLRCLQDPEMYNKRSAAGIDTYLKKFTAERYTDALIDILYGADGQL